MTIGADLTTELRVEVLSLQDDLQQRLSRLPDTLAEWRDEHQRAVQQKRTGQSWSEWSNDRITQVAVAWVLTTVFIRFCEDNELVSPVWFAGPKRRWVEATEAQATFIRRTARENPDVTEREWLLEAIGHLRRMRATRALVDEHSPLWLIAPSGDAAARLLAFWREKKESGGLRWNFADAELDTRFLGDLYQDLSESARARYALLQTPVFVEELILDQTLSPALRARKLDDLRIIDPTCGSGHFLLGAFRRILDRWHLEAPGINERERVQRALDSIHGVDVNPFAVAIARFRLMVAALRASGMRSLENVPAFRFHLAVGDSLLHGRNGAEQFELGMEFVDDRQSAAFTYTTENFAVLRQILIEDRYDVVVGNPPYITASDKALNTRYRRLYKHCKGTYALTVPFMERFFALAKSGDEAGWVGQITSNSFMKREFGASIIENFLSKLDLSHVIDTSGAYIPGHGTPTVVIVGRNRAMIGSTVRAVLGVRSEPCRPEDPAKGKVWLSIIAHLGESDYEDDWITVTDLDRKHLAGHPWSLAGGGAIELKEAVESAAASRMSKHVVRIGLYGDTHADEAFFIPSRFARRLGVAAAYIHQSARGEEVRDWWTATGESALLPYDDSGRVVDSATLGPRTVAAMWPLRTFLWSRLLFSGETYRRGGRSWLAWHQLPRDVDAATELIAFAFVATHNHFVFDRGGKVFNRTAPVIKLPRGATEAEHLGLLGTLNSSVACFWLKQESHNKGRPGAEQAGADEPWEHRFEFTGSTLLDFPLPMTLPERLARRLDALACEFAACQPGNLFRTERPTRSALDSARARATEVRGQMIALQEELDWSVYHSYGLVGPGFVYGDIDLPGLQSSERAFTLELARAESVGDSGTSWFDHHNHAFPRVKTIRSDWPESYQELVTKRIDLIQGDRFIRLLERPEHKRRWAADRWERHEERALREWLLDRLEDGQFWFDPQGRPTPWSIAALADRVSRDQDVRSVLALWEGRPDVPVLNSLEKLLIPEAVPFLAAYRYKDSGLRKRLEWEHVWALQRREDDKAYEPSVDGPIPLPPKYTSSDFQSTDYWRHRGKLDVPKERFIAYLHAGRETDPSLVIGWAGWDHAQQSLALATLVQQRESEGAAGERLIPLVAGLVELLPWVKQWHDDPNPLYGGGSPAEFFSAQVDTRSAQLGQTPEQLTAWKPPQPRRGRRARASR